MALLNVVYARLKLDKLQLTNHLNPNHVEKQLRQQQQQLHEEGTHLCVCKTSRTLLALCLVDLLLA